MSDSQLISAQAREATNVLLWFSFGIYFSDTLAFTRREKELFNKNQHFQWFIFPYFTSKLAVWMYFFIKIGIDWSEEEVECPAASFGLESLSALCILTSSLVLVHCIIQLFEGKARRNATLLLLFLFLIMAISWVFGIQDLDSHWKIGVLQVWKKGACGLEKMKGSFSIKHGMTFLFLSTLISLVICSRSSSIRSEVGPRKASILYLSGLSIFNLAIFIISVLEITSQLKALFIFPFIVMYSMVTIRLYFKLGATKEISGCGNSVVIPMENNVKDYESLAGESLTAPASTSFLLRGLGSGEQIALTPSHFSRNISEASNKVSVKRAETSFVDEVADVLQIQTPLECSSSKSQRSLLPFKLSVSGRRNDLETASSPDIQNVEKPFQDPWNQISPSSLSSFSLNPINTSLANPDISTSSNPKLLESSRKGPTRNQASQNKLKRPGTPKRPITPNRKNKGQDQEQNQERPSTANSYTQRMAIAMESNSR